MPRRLFAVAAAAVAALSLVTTSSAQADTGPLDYVALGDSYSAASGVLPPDPAAPLLCLRSTRNYPHVLATRTGALSPIPAPPPMVRPSITAISCLG